MHNLIHLAKDVKNLGNINKFSAFPFESFLCKLKDLLRKNEKPLQQLHNRLVEFEKAEINKTLKAKSSKTFSGEYSGGVLIKNCCGPEFKKIQFSNFIIKTNKPDNCCMLNDGSIVLIENICHDNTSTPVFIGRSFQRKTDFYHVPCPSSKLNIYEVNSPSKLQYWHLSAIKYKCCYLKYKSNFVIYPLIHTQT